MGSCQCPGNWHSLLRAKAAAAAKRLCELIWGRIRGSAAFLKSVGHSLGLPVWILECKQKASYSALQKMIIPANLRGCEVPQATHLPIM
jgi:hypothetical protein